MAAAKRKTEVLPGAFHEPNFIYLRQTIQIWNIREYMKNPKWREDAIRRSEKRKALSDNDENLRKKRKIKSGRRRFRNFMNEWYRKSLESGQLEANQDEGESPRKK
mmetsp:Transcript_19480/g.45313  ORF Transcript_19480/g.45313 Transcript_19480/m.45313 type:complete len:106 (-) Transcript_19480:66-383(-)